MTSTRFGLFSDPLPPLSIKEDLLLKICKSWQSTLQCPLRFCSMPRYLDYIEIFPYRAKCCKTSQWDTLVFQLQDTVCLFGTLLVFDPIHLPKSDTWCLIGSEQKEKEPLLLIGSCCCEVYQFWRGWFLMSHSLYLEHVIQNDNRDLHSTRYIFNLVSHYFYSAHDTNEVVSHYFYSAHLF